MVEYLTKYPKTVSFVDVICGSLKGIVKINNISSVEQLHVVVKKNADELFRIFLKEGFTNTCRGRNFSRLSSASIWAKNTCNI